MLILYNPNEYVSVVDRQVCDYHKRKPWDTNYPGCTCSTSYSRRLATPEERDENIRNRNEETERRRKHIVDYDSGHLTFTGAEGVAMTHSFFYLMRPWCWFRGHRWLEPGCRLRDYPGIFVSSCGRCRAYRLIVKVNGRYEKDRDDR